VGYKHAHRWADVLRACDEAVALAPDDAEGPHWNAGIAATALGHWDRARREWSAVGVHVPPGEGPIEMKIGLAPVRVAVHEAPEVVWCERIDPCRAYVRSVPLPASRRRHGDLVLHDGEPRGTRQLGDREVSVFDELVVLAPSEYETWDVAIRCASREELAAVTAELEAAHLTVEDWTENVQALCAACSLGHPHERHERPPEGAWQAERRLGIAARGRWDLAVLRPTRLWWRKGVLSAKRVL
jgi:hypothetical protein